MILFSRLLPDGRTAEIYELTHGRARLGVATPAELGHEYHDEW